MRHTFRYLSYLLLAILATSCAQSPPPVDKNGKSPEDILLETYTLIVQGQLAEAQKAFSPQFLDTFAKPETGGFEQYCSPAKGWKVEWLKTKLVGNDYNDALWRVKIIPDEGKGAENGPGIVQDLTVIDGEWKIVFWNHYPKS